MERNQTDNCERGTAYHEAGHAVVALSVGAAKPESVSILSDEDSLGRVSTEPSSFATPTKSTLFEDMRAKESPSEWESQTLAFLAAVEAKEDAGQKLSEAEQDYLAFLGKIEEQDATAAGDSLDGAEEKMVMCLAGVQAEAESAGLDEPTEDMLGGASHDYEVVGDLSLRVAGNGEAASRLCDELIERAKELVREPETWKAITAVAEALIEEKCFGLELA